LQLLGPRTGNLRLLAPCNNQQAITSLRGKTSSQKALG